MNVLPVSLPQSRNETNVDIELDGVQQRADSMSGSLEYLRHGFEEIDRTLRDSPSHATQPQPSSDAVSIPPPPPYVPPALVPPPPYDRAFLSPSYQQGTPATVSGGPSRPKRSHQGDSSASNRSRRNLFPLPTPIPPGVETGGANDGSPHAFVRLGNVQWSKEPRNPLEGQVLFIAACVFDANPAVRGAYLHSTFIPGKLGWISMEFVSREYSDRLPILQWRKIGRAHV